MFCWKCAECDNGEINSDWTCKGLSSRLTHILAQTHRQRIFKYFRIMSSRIPEAKVSQTGDFSDGEGLQALMVASRSHDENQRKVLVSLTSVQVGSQTTTNSGLQSNSPEISDLLKQIGALERRLQESENQIAELKNKATTRVAFSAVAGGGDAGGYIGPFGWDTTFIFKKVLTNIGNAYNNDTGIFTAPVTGLYYFGFFHHAQTLYTSGLFLIKNDENIVMTYDHPSKEDRADNAGNVVLLELQKDDRVYLRLGGSSAVWGHDYITTFSGFLLSQE